MRVHIDPLTPSAESNQRFNDLHFRGATAAAGQRLDLPPAAPGSCCCSSGEYRKSYTRCSYKTCSFALQIDHPVLRLPGSSAASIPPGACAWQSTGRLPPQRKMFWRPTASASRIDAPLQQVTAPARYLVKRIGQKACGLSWNCTRSALPTRRH